MAEGFSVVFIKSDGAQHGQPATTDSEGNYEISNVPYGTTGKIEVTKIGYDKVTKEGIEVKADVSVDSIEPTILKYTINGTLSTNYADGGLEGFEVGLYANAESTEPIVDIDTTTAEGKYELKNINYGTTGVIKVTKTGYTSTPVAVAAVTADKAINVSASVIKANVVVTAKTDAFAEGFTATLTQGGETVTSQNFEITQDAGTTLTFENLVYSFDTNKKYKVTLSKTGYTDAATEEFAIDSSTAKSYEATISIMKYTVKGSAKLNATPSEDVEAVQEVP